MLDLIRTGLNTLAKGVTGTGAVLTNGGVISIPLNKTFLTRQLFCDIQVSQGFTGVPTSSDMRRMFKTVSLVVDKGDGVKLNFPAAYDLMRLTNPNVQSYVTLAVASTARFGFQLQGMNDGAIGGLITAWLAGQYSSMELRFELNPDANTGFIGGTVPTAATYQIDVYPDEFRDITPAVRSDKSGGWGVAEHAGVMLSTITGGVGGNDQQWSLKSGNKTRFLFLHAFDSASYGNLTDAVWLNGATFSLNIDGKVVYNQTAAPIIKAKNDSDRMFSQVGVVVLDAGDDPLGWWDLRNIKDPKIEINIPASANLPAAWRIEVAQDYTKGLEALASYPVAKSLIA